MPSNVRNFFWLNVLSLALGVPVAIMTSSKLYAAAAAGGQGPGFIIGIQVTTMAVLLLLLWLIAFKRRNWARWVWIALFVLGTPGYIAIFRNLFGISVAGAISLMQLALQLVALYSIFTGNASGWFRRDSEKVEVDAF
jgi:hypothetical protein